MKYSLHWKLYEWDNTIQPAIFRDDCTDMTNSGYVFDRVIEIEMSPHVDRAAITASAVAELRSEQAELQNAITELERRIMELQCIEYKGD